MIWGYVVVSFRLVLKCLISSGSGCVQCHFRVFHGYLDNVYLSCCFCLLFHLVGFSCFPKLCFSLLFFCRFLLFWLFLVFLLHFCFIVLFVLQVVLICVFFVSF